MAFGSGSNNNNNNNNHGNREVEIEIFNRFSRIAKDKFSSIATISNGRRGLGSDSSSSTTSSREDHNNNNNLKHLDELYKRPEFNAERRVLEEMNNLGLRGGILCGLSCFAILRMGPGMISRMMLMRRSNHHHHHYNHKSSFYNGSSTTTTTTTSSTGGGYTFDTLPPPPTTSTTVFGAAESVHRTKPGWFFRLVRLAVDTFVSLSVGAYASVYFTDTDKMMTQFANIPLLPGRSLLSEELCEEFTNEFRKFDRRVWEDQEIIINKTDGDIGGGGGGGVGGGGGTVDFRSTITTFVANCRRRQLYEEELRKENGGLQWGSSSSSSSGSSSGGMMDDNIDNDKYYPIEEDEPVIIPPPGVPSDIHVSLDDLMGDGNPASQSEEIDKNGLDEFDTFFDGEKDNEHDE